MWNLNIAIINRIQKEVDPIDETKFDQKINEHLYKIDHSIIDFRFNVCIALFYEIYNIFKTSMNLKINNQLIKSNFVKVILAMTPFTPHLSHECLENQGYTDQLSWPKVKKGFNQSIKIAIQINGKTRDVLELKKDLKEKEITKEILKKSNAKKYLQGRNIKKIIYIKNKIINYIV